MHTHDLSAWQHDHQFGAGNASAERSTRLVMWITAAMMVVEIGAGWWFNSMALLADGWHMSSHALAIGLSAFAYAAARRYARDPRFAFGTWKIEVLGGFASALLLLGIAALMVVGSLERLWSPARSTTPRRFRWRCWGWWSTWSARGCWAARTTIMGTITDITITATRTTITRTNTATT
jgi:Co/Zn/Cd efflux system component